MEEKRTEEVRPSFIKLIVWAIGAVGFMYLTTIWNSSFLKVINTICSFWCAIVAIAEAYLIHMGQGTINDTIDKMNNKE